MGEVFRAFDERLHREVAIKRAHQKSGERSTGRKRLLKEARSVARLNHPNIVRIHDVISEAGTDWLIMELVDGETLSQRLSRGVLPPDGVITIGLGIADALVAAHQAQIIHRDLKAQNVILSPSGRPKVLDFGLTKWATESESTTLTVDGQILGTPHAMSPEQAMGRRVDTRSDLFALGSLLYEMASGEAPFKGRDPLDCIHRVCTERPIPLQQRNPEVPTGLAQLVARLLEKDPSHRPQSAMDVRRTLRRLETGLDVAGAPSHSQSSQATLVDEDAVMPFDLSERRQITALYCEFVVNSSEETRKGPPEEHEFLSAFDRILGNVVGEFHGYLENRSIGNRSLACFGYPEAREDDTIRAFHCARRLHEEVARLNTTTPSPVRLSIRTVLHTGPAVILRTNGREQLVLGTTVDTAEGLLHKANNDQILVTGPTRRLILGRLHPDEMVYVGSNLSDKLETYQIQKDSKGDSGSWTDEPDTPFIGREREVDLLRSCCQLATDGRGQIILMTGEPGVGKSRLAHEVRRDSSAAMQWRQGQCVQRLANTPLVPFTEILRKMFAISSIGTAVEQRADLRSGLERLGCAVDESLPLLAPVLEIPLPEDVEQSPWSPEKRREMTFDLIIRLLLEPSEDTSFGILIEDLHWADPSTLELVGQLIPRIRAARGLLLMTARPEFSPPWESANHTSLDLSRLSTPVTGALIEAVAGGKGLPDDVVQLIVSRTDGIPLFVQELTRYLLESKHFIEQDDRWELREVLANLEVPTTLRSSLAARLERLGEAKPLLQLASVVGREFSLAVIGAVSEIEQEALSVALHQLVDAKLLRRRGYGRRARYLFRHALIQEAAYDSLLLKQRTDWHHRVAETLESRFPDIAISKPELLGHHLEHAQEPLRAVDYFHSAGKLHTNDSAFVEAMSHFERGLRLLETVPHSPRTSRQELSLQMARCRPLLATEGYTTEVFQTIASRAQELHGGSKDLHELHPFLFRFAYLYVNQGDNTHVHEAALRCRETAERIGSPVALATSDFVDGAIHLFQGSLKRSLALLDSSAAVFDVSQHSEISWLYGDNPMLKSIMARAWVHTLAGNFPGAWRDLDSLRQIARELEEPFNTIRAVMFKVGLSCDLEYQEGISDLIEEAHSLSVENNVPHYRILAETHRGLSAMFDGSRDAFRDVRGRIEEMRALGAMALLPVYLTRLARAHLEVDQLEMGLRAAEEALAVTEGNLGIFYEAESFRLKGALLARLGNDLHEADRCFQRALLIARRQGALLFEIRAALGRVHLAKDFKTSDEPIDQLAASLGRFNGVVPESERAQAELLCDDLRLAREWQANCGRRVPLDTH